MTDPGVLAARVAQRYERLDLPSWPDPRDGAAPRDDEYSRVTEPGRYRIVHARARVWAEELGALPEIEAEPIEETDAFDRGVRLRSSRPGTLPLFMLERDAPVAVLHLGVARPEIPVAVLPDCGCDACDSGSADLLRAIDKEIGNVISGPLAVVRGTGWYARRHRGGGASRGGDHGRLMELCRRLIAGEDVPLPEGAEAFVGRPWC